MRRYIGLLATTSVVVLLGLGAQPGQAHLGPKPNPRTAKNGHFPMGNGRVAYWHASHGNRHSPIQLESYRGSESEERSLSSDEEVMSR